ncbi:hypothetical protein [Lactococcus lactis]|uniref:hypothetical protein n=1 Tax=Lactococcus lactis TaxID=1358 RepID=UPI00207475D3|nr:hypothetical protein [Lactococcus lactis]
MKKILLAILIVGTTIAVGFRVSADSLVYRLYNHNTGEHFYTTSATERDFDIKVGWTDEGLGWVAPDKGTTVYRIYNPNAVGGDHYYTKSKYEAQSLVNKGWKWDNQGKAVFYSGGNLPIYVAYNPNAQSGAHNYTGNSNEENNLINIGWKYKAVAWNAVSLSVNPSNNSLQELADGMNAESSNIISESGGIFTKAIVTVSGNTLVITFTLSQNMGVVSPDEIVGMKNNLASLFNEKESIFKSIGIANLSVRYNFKNPDGSLAASIAYP